MFFKMFLLCVFFHFVADFTLQGCLADLKQKAWWLKQCVEHNISFDKYRKDYITALIIHSAYWSILTFAPLWAFIEDIRVVLLMLLVNIAIHAFVDDVKANRLLINLQQDQLAHLAQIIVTQLAVWRFVSII